MLPALRPLRRRLLRRPVGRGGGQTQPDRHPGQHRRRRRDSSHRTGDRSIISIHYGGEFHRSRRWHVDGPTRDAGAEVRRSRRHEFRRWARSSSRSSRLLSEQGRPVCGDQEVCPTTDRTICAPVHTVYPGWVPTRNGTDGGEQRRTVHAAGARSGAPRNRSRRLYSAGCLTQGWRSTWPHWPSLHRSCGLWHPALTSGCGPPGEQSRALELRGRVAGRDPRWDIRDVRGRAPRSRGDPSAIDQNRLLHESVRAMRERMFVHQICRLSPCIGSSRRK